MGLWANPFTFLKKKLAFAEKGYNTFEKPTKFLEVAIAPGCDNPFLSVHFHFIWKTHSNMTNQWILWPQVCCRNDGWDNDTFVSLDEKVLNLNKLSEFLQLSKEGELLPSHESKGLQDYTALQAPKNTDWVLEIIKTYIRDLFIILDKKKYDDREPLYQVVKQVHDEETKWDYKLWESSEPLPPLSHEKGVPGPHLLVDKTDVALCAIGGMGIPATVIPAMMLSGVLTTVLTPPIWLTGVLCTVLALGGVGLILAPLYLLDKHFNRGKVLDTLQTFITAHKLPIMSTVSLTIAATAAVLLFSGLAAVLLAASVYVAPILLACLVLGGTVAFLCGSHFIDVKYNDAGIYNFFKNQAAEIHSTFTSGFSKLHHD